MFDAPTSGASPEGVEVMPFERNRFELSYATRLNRTVGLYFGLRP